MRKIYIIFLTILFMVPISWAQDKGKVNVAAAANLDVVLNDLKSEFIKENPGIEVNIILGSSGKLTSQIINGADFDVFMAADMNFPQQVESKGYGISKTTFYAGGKLILFSKNNLDFSKGLSVLTDSKVEHIAIANPKLAPYGKASIQAIENAKLKNIDSKFVYSENINQTAEYTLIAADAGFIAKSLLFSPKMKEYNVKGKYWIDVDSTLYEPINQGMILLKNSEKNTGAKKFYDFILSKSAKAIFRKYGYI
jgi:molybdate transport system substrate-binding protein